MKYIAPLFIAVALFITGIFFAYEFQSVPVFGAVPPSTVPQGGTGWGAFANGAIPFGSGFSLPGSLRLATSSGFTFASSTNTLSVTNLTVTSCSGCGGSKFGGTGANGALSISSGTTNIDLASTSIVVKNYTSISITGTGALTFSRPNDNGTIIILKSQGACTLTSSATPMIDDSRMGAVGGTAVTNGSTNAFVTGPGGNNGISAVFQTQGGPAPAGQTTPSPGGAVPLAAYANAFSQFLLRYGTALVGSGGGAGGANANGSSGTSGAGGRGGGGLIMECAGGWNFTTASGVSVAGGNGTAASASGSAVATGGGAGSGGFFLALYNSLIANTGTVVVTGGSGGANNVRNGTSASGGSGGGFITAGNPGNNVGTTLQGGGDGAMGTSTIAQNTEF